MLMALSLTLVAPSPRCDFPTIQVLAQLPRGTEIRKRTHLLRSHYREFGRIRGVAQDNIDERARNCRDRRQSEVEIIIRISGSSINY